MAIGRLAKSVTEKNNEGKVREGLIFDKNHTIRMGIHLGFRFDQMRTRTEAFFLYNFDNQLFHVVRNSILIILYIRISSGNFFKTKSTYFQIVIFI